MIVELPAAARYSLDTNCFITSWQRTYPPDMFQPVWAHLERLADDGIVVVSNVVLLELERKADEVCAWCQDHEHMFLDLIEAVQANVTVIERDFPKLLKGNRNMADPFVIGVAQLAVPPLTVVTEERLGQANLERPNIPFVCDAFGAPYCTFIQMLRDTGFRFA